MGGTDTGKTAQVRRIRQVLESGGSITPLEALRWFGCLRLGARIWDLRHAGLDISMVWEESDGKRYARYQLRGEEE